VNDAPWNTERYYDLREPAGEGFTRWYFMRPDRPENSPLAAVKIRIAKHPPYMAQAMVFCEGKTCEPVLENVRLMPPPVPDVSADPELRSSWLQAIANEPCARGLPAMPTEKYPAEELKRGIGGRVELKLVTDSCGQVRGSFTSKSSGNRGLDRAARRQSLSWRLPAPAGEQGNRYWISSVEFSPGGTPAQEHESITTNEPTAIPALTP
jgi:TonB family protein